VNSLFLHGPSYVTGPLGATTGANAEGDDEHAYTRQRGIDRLLDEFAALVSNLSTSVEEVRFETLDLNSISANFGVGSLGGADYHIWTTTYWSPWSSQLYSETTYSHPLLCRLIPTAIPLKIQYNSSSS
jgi:hypothetical protein